MKAFAVVRREKDVGVNARGAVVETDERGCYLCVLESSTFRELKDEDTQ